MPDHESSCAIITWITSLMPRCLCMCSHTACDMQMHLYFAFDDC